MQSRAEGNIANQPCSKQSTDYHLKAWIPKDKSLIGFSAAFLCKGSLLKSRKSMLIIAGRISNPYLKLWTPVVNH